MKKETLCIYLKCMREQNLEAVHSVLHCISDFAFLLVNCFQVQLVRKKRHKSNKFVEIVH